MHLHRGHQSITSIWPFKTSVWKFLMPFRKRQASAQQLPSSGNISLACFRVFLKQTKLKRNWHSEKYSTHHLPKIHKRDDFCRKPAWLLTTFRSFTHCEPALVSTDQTMLQLTISLKQVQFSSPRLLMWLSPVFQFPGSLGTINIITQTFNWRSIASKNIIFLLCPALQRAPHFSAN